MRPRRASCNLGYAGLLEKQTLIRIPALCLATGLALIAGAGLASRRTLAYGPKVTLTGRLSSRVFPGPPNYESVKKGDTAERAYLLHLDAPVDVAGKAQNEFDQPQRNLRDFQLAPTSDALFAAARRMVGRRVIVTGTLFGEHTGHHHTPVLISVERLRSAR